MDIFEFIDYKKFAKKSFEKMPKRGHGQLGKLAKYMNVHSTFISQVFNGDKALNPEQGLLVAEFLGLNPLETQYLIKLIQKDRAGSEKYKNILQKEINELQDKARKISNRLTEVRSLRDEQKAIFYSDWYYSAIRLQVDIDGYQDLESISNHFGLPRQLAGEILDFLQSANLVERDGEKLKVGPSRTHLEPDSPFIKLHHLNWRQKALENIKSADISKLHYSAPMTLSKSDYEVVRKKIVKLIEEIGRVVDPSPPEELVCLNIDWFKVKPS